jgi:signal transduction histidine kinase
VTRRGGLSLRGRTTVVAVALVAVVLAVGAWVLVRTLDREVTASTDQLSRTRVDALLAQVADGSLPAVLTQLDDDSVAQVFGVDGTVMAASRNITGRPAITAPADTGRPVLRAFDGPDDQETETYRAWVASTPTAGGEVTAVVGTSLERVHETSARLRTLLLVGVPVAVALLGVIVWLLLGRALGRLDRIRAEVDAIGPNQLARRIDVTGPDDEVGRLASTMNRMLTRVDSAVSRQRQLVADVSHDLQTPLAAQRLAVETALGSPGDEHLREVLRSTEEMESLVGDLLVLAAVDEGVTPAAHALDLDALVLEEAARTRSASGIRIHTRSVSAGPVRGNATELRRAVRNLVDNAVAYAATSVELSVTTADGQVVLDVRDDGPGVPAEERELVFERFHRGDRARARDVPGSGLGLPIARTLVERAGGRLDLVESRTGAHFRVVLPAWPTV